MTPDTTTKYPSLLTLTAKMISYIFHPLFIPTYIFLFLKDQFPYTFVDITEWELSLKTFSTFWMTAFFPAFGVFLLWKLKFIDNIFLRTQKERIIPYFICMFFYWWMFYLGRSFTNQPAVLKPFYLGIFFATIIGVLVNNFIKISLHAMGMAGGLAAVILFAFYYHAPLGLPISVACIFTGLVCSSRFLISDHTEPEIYTGLIAGAVCQIVAFRIM
jgi:hypothetical protein